MAGTPKLLKPREIHRIKTRPRKSYKMVIKSTSHQNQALRKLQASVYSAYEVKPGDICWPQENPLEKLQLTHLTHSTVTNGDETSSDRVSMALQQPPAARHSSLSCVHTAQALATGAPSWLPSSWASRLHSFYGQTVRAWWLWRKL